jgi:hypothetical protein
MGRDGDGEQRYQSQRNQFLGEVWVNEGVSGIRVG